MMSTLWSLKQHHKAQILSLSKQLPKEISGRLESLGLYKDAQIQCLKFMPFGGPRVYQIGDSVFSFTRDLAELIQIEDLPERSLQ